MRYWYLFDRGFGGAVCGRERGGGNFLQHLEMHIFLESTNAFS